MLITTFIFSTALAGTPPSSEADAASLSADDAEVVIVSSSSEPEPQKDAAVATRVISRDQIEASGATQVEQLLEMIPGVQYLPGVRSSGLSLGGHDPRHTLVLIDGRRMIGRIGGDLDLRRLSTADIERIEIIQGPTSALYGTEAIGGVIHIITRGSRKPWRVEAGLQGAGRVSADRATEAVAALPLLPSATWLDGTAAHARFDGRIGLLSGHVGASTATYAGWDADPGTAATDGDAQQTLQADAHLQLGDRAHVRLDGRHGLLQGQGVDATATGARFDRTFATRTTDATLSFALPFASEWTARGALSGSLFTDATTSDQRGSDALDTHSLTRQWLAQADGSVGGWLPGRAHHVLFGAQGLGELVTADRVEQGIAPRARGAVFGQYSYHTGDTWTLLAGLRGDCDSLFGGNVSPRVAVRFRPFEALQIRAGAGTGFRAPDFKQLYMDFSNPGVGYRVAGNAELRPERSMGVHLSATVDAHADIALELTGRHDQVVDLITTDLVGDDVGTAALYSYVNVGRARIQSLTTDLQLLHSRPVHLDLTYVLLDAWDLEHDRKLPGRSTHQLTGRLSASHAPSGLTASLAANLLSERPFYVGDEVELRPATALVDLQIRWAATQSLFLQAGVDNLLDTGTPDLTRPRRVYAGVTGRFAAPDPGVQP